MALNSRILAAKSQVFGVMGISNADKEFVVKVRSLEIPSYLETQIIPSVLVYKRC